MLTIHATAFLAALCRHSLTAAVVIALALVARAIAFRGTVARWRTVLWALVLVRLLMPTMPASRWSVMNASDWWPSGARAKAPIEQMASPVIDLGTRQVELRGFLPADGVSMPLSQLAQHVETESRWPMVLVGLWATGAICVIGQRVVLHILFLKKIRNVVTVSDGALAAILDEACERMGVRRAPMLRLTDVTSTPALAGLLRPQLLLPPAVVESLSPGQLRLVMLHEVAHLRRGDLWVDLFLTCVLAMHWFNPMAWVAAALYRSDREIVRDAMVLRAAGDVASQDYGRTIVLLVERLAFSGGTPIGAVGILERWGGIGQRIRAVVDRRRPGVVAVVMAVAATVVVGCAGMTDAKRKTASSTELPGVRSAKDQAAETALDRKIQKFEMEDKPIIEAFDALAQEMNVPIVVDWKALESAGVRRDGKFSGRLRDIRASKVLFVLLNEIKHGEDLDFIIQHGVINVSTEAALFRRTAQTRVYDVHDLLVEIPDFDDAPVLRGEEVARQKPAERPMTRDERVAAVLKLVQEVIDPTSWSRGASIQEAHGQLVVHQSARNQEELVGLLSQLRETRGLTITLQARFVVADENSPDLSPAVRRMLSLAGEGTYLDDKQTEQLRSELDSRGGDGQHAFVQGAAPRITMFNGQRAWVMMTGPAVSYVSGYKRAGRDAKYEPVKSEASSRVLLDAQATISADRRYVTVTLRPQVSSLEGMRDEPWEGDAGLTIQRPLTTELSFETTVSMPDRGTLLCSGFSAGRQSFMNWPTTRPSSMPRVNPQLPAKAGPKIFLLIRPEISLNAAGGRVKSTR